MLFNPNSKGLELFEKAIRENAHTMSSELLEGLTHAYEVTNDEMEEVEGMEGYYIEDVSNAAHDHMLGITSSIDAAQEKIDRLYDKMNDDSLEEFFLGVSKIIEGIQVEEFEYETFSEAGETDKEQIEKMVNAGYKFNNGIGLQITLEIEEAKHKEETERKLKAIEEKRKQEQKELHDNIEKDWKEFAASLSMEGLYIDKADGHYSLYSYSLGIDARYDVNKEKITGKGSRNYKEQLLKCAAFYVELENNKNIA